VQFDPSGYGAIRGEFTRMKVTVSAAVTAANMNARVARFFEEKVVLRGKLYAVEEFTLLPRDFVEDVTRARGNLTREGKYTPAAGRFPPRLTPFRPPPVHRFVRTGPKKEMATAAYVLGEDPCPLLAWWRYGLGRAVAFTSSLEEDWAPEWRMWGRSARDGSTERLLPFWNDWIRWAARRDGGGRVRVHADDGGVKVELRGGGGDPLPDGMDYVARLLFGGRKIEEKPMVQEGIGSYGARFETDAPGYYRITVFDRGEKASLGEGGIHVGSSLELGALGPDEEALRRLAAGGGRYWDDVSLFQPGLDSARRMGAVDAGWILCIASAVCLVLFAFVRPRRSRP
jgi:hypothetical protein